jgi:hypothetical protein
MLNFVRNVEFSGKRNIFLDSLGKQFNNFNISFSSFRATIKHYDEPLPNKNFWKWVWKQIQVELKIPSPDATTHSSTPQYRV